MSLRSRKSLIKKLFDNKKYRDAHVAEHVRNGVPFQIRTLRDQRGWTQGDLGQRAGKPQNVISRLENPDYGKLTIQTLLEIAAAFDVALLVKFVPFSRLLPEFEDVSPKGLSAESISVECATSQESHVEERLKIEHWAQAEETHTPNQELTEAVMRLVSNSETQQSKFGAYLSRPASQQAQPTYRVPPGQRMGQLLRGH